MAIDLTDQILSLLTPEMVQKVATNVGESESATQKALGAIAPGLVAALTNMALTPSGAQQVTRMLDSGPYNGSALGNLAALLSGGAAPPVAISESRGILSSLFGSKITAVTELIARYAGVRPNSASSLLTMAVPLVMHVLGSRRASFGQSPSALATLLGEQRRLLDRWLPRASPRSRGGQASRPGRPTLPPRRHRPPPAGPGGSSFRCSSWAGLCSSGSWPGSGVGRVPRAWPSPPR